MSKSKLVFTLFNEEFWFKSFTRLEVITNQIGVLFFETPGTGRNLN